MGDMGDMGDMGEADDILHPMQNHQALTWEGAMVWLNQYVPTSTQDLSSSTSSSSSSPHSFQAQSLEQIHQAFPEDPVCRHLYQNEPDPNVLADADADAKANDDATDPATTATTTTTLTPTFADAHTFHHHLSAWGQTYYAVQRFSELLMYLCHPSELTDNKDRIYFCSPTYMCTRCRTPLAPPESPTYYYADPALTRDVQEAMQYGHRTYQKEPIVSAALRLPTAVPSSTSPTAHRGYGHPEEWHDAEYRWIRGEEEDPTNTVAASHTPDNRPTRNTLPTQSPHYDTFGRVYRWTDLLAHTEAEWVASLEDTDGNAYAGAVGDDHMTLAEAQIQIGVNVDGHWCTLHPDRGGRRSRVASVAQMEMMELVKLEGTPAPTPPQDAATLYKDRYQRLHLSSRPIPPAIQHQYHLQRISFQDAFSNEPSNTSSTTSSITCIVHVLDTLVGMVSTDADADGRSWTTVPLTSLYDHPRKSRTVSSFTNAQRGGSSRGAGRRCGGGDTSSTSSSSRASALSTTLAFVFIATPKGVMVVNRKDYPLCVRYRQRKMVDPLKTMVVPRSVWKDLDSGSSTETPHDHTRHTRYARQRCLQHVHDVPARPGATPVGEGDGAEW